MQALTLNKTAQLQLGPNKLTNIKDVKMQALHPETSNGRVGNSPNTSSRMKKRMKDKINGCSNVPNESNIEMSKLELLKLLGIFEGELQARDEVINILKQSQPATKERQGSPDEAIKALQRDAKQMKEVETQYYNSYMEEKFQMSTVVQQHKEAYDRLKNAHLALEEKYQMLLDNVENERDKHREYRKKSEDLVKVIDTDREELKRLLREKSIQDPNEDEWSSLFEWKEDNGKTFGKKMKKLKRFEKLKRHGRPLITSKSLDHGGDQENNLKELEELRKTVAGMKEAEKVHLQVAKQYQNLQETLANELTKTNSLREQIDELKKILHKKTKTEKYFEEALAKFDELQLKYEDECKKQSKIQHQITVWSQKFETVNELEMLLKSSECKLIQFQTMLREAKQEKKELAAKLQQAETNSSAKDSLLQSEKLKVEEAFRQTAEERKKSQALSQKQQKLETKQARDIKSLHAKVGETEETVPKDKVAEMQLLINNLRNELQTLKQRKGTSAKQEEKATKKDQIKDHSKTNEQLEEFVIKEEKGVIGDNKSEDINQNYLTLAVPNPSLAQEVKNLESHIQTKRPNTEEPGQKKASKRTDQKKIMPGTAENKLHLNHNNDDRSTATPSARNGQLRRTLQKRSVSCTDIKPNTKKSNSLNLSRASSKPTTAARQEMIPMTQIKSSSEKSDHSNHIQQAYSESTPSSKRLEHRTTALSDHHSKTMSNPKLKPPKSQSHQRLPKHETTGASTVSSLTFNRSQSSGEGSKSNKLLETSSAQSKRGLSKHNSFDKKQAPLISADSKSGRSYSMGSKPVTFGRKPTAKSNTTSNESNNSKLSKPKSGVPQPHSKSRSRLARSSLSSLPK